MFGHAAKVKLVLEEAGYTFNLRESDSFWEMYDCNKMVAHSRSLGDLIRKQANELGVW